jgi:TDG/mug DNA glycosylase family protein
MKRQNHGERMFLSHGFGPVYDSDSRILILGSFPSVKSREQSFYYGHPQNRFWKVVAAIAGCDVPETIEDKKQMLLSKGIAVYDVIESCSIIGSDDSSIEDVTVTDIAPILSGTRITDGIYTNGGKAYKLYMKYIFPDIGLEAVKLPSTSPANAAYSLDRLISIWTDIIKEF